MSADGIGAYFSPVEFAPVTPQQTINAPLRHTNAGIGAYFSPSEFAPVTPMSRINAPLQRTGMGAFDAKPAVWALLIFGVVGFWLLRKDFALLKGK
jgi:hypothetical protein